MESQRTQVVEEGVSIEEEVLQGEGSEGEDQLSSLLAKAYPFLATVYLVRLAQSLTLATVAVVVANAP